jgi:hypothetical protein
LNPDPDLFPGDTAIQNDAVRNTDLTKVEIANSEYHIAILKG